MTRGPVVRTVTGVFLIAAALGGGVGVVAQRGGGRGGGGGTPVPTGDLRSRLQILTDAFGLERDARNAVRATLDAAHKEAEPLRAALLQARVALAESIVAGAPADAGAAAARIYGEAATAMASHEMKSLVKVREHLTPEQRKLGTAVAFYLMRGMFLDDRRWDERPERRNY